MSFWLFDSRHRGSAKHAKRVLRIYPETPQGRITLWQHVLRSEVTRDEWEGYEGLYDPSDWDDMGEDYAREWTRQSVEIFNDYWGCYGWWLCCAEEGEHVKTPDDCLLQE